MGLLIKKDRTNQVNVFQQLVEMMIGAHAFETKLNKKGIQN